jgi:hypothetical protein
LAFGCAPYQEVGQREGIASWGFSWGKETAPLIDPTNGCLPGYSPGDPILPCDDVRVTKGREPDHICPTVPLHSVNLSGLMAGVEHDQQPGVATGHAGLDPAIDLIRNGVPFVHDE